MNITPMKYCKLFTVILISATLFSSGCASVDSMIKKGEYIQADNYCSSLEGEKKKECYRKLASHYLAKKDYLRAGQYFNKGGFSKVEYNTQIAEACIADGSFDRAGDFFRLAGLPDNQIYMKLAEASMAAAKFIDASRYYAKSGNSDSEIDALSRALEVSDKKIRIEAVAALSESDNKKALSLLEGLLLDTDPEIRSAARFTIQRKKGGPLTVAYLSIGSTGRRALDGLISTVYILKEMMLLDKKGGTNKYTIEKQLQRVLGPDGYTLKKISVKSLKRKSRSVVKPIVIDKRKVKKIMESGDYDIIISQHSHWYEYTKYVKNRQQTPPLKMKISYDFLVYIPALKKKKEFTFSVLHIESSKSTDKIKKQKAQALTGTLIHKKKTKALQELETYLSEALK